jgi:GR25 family glycosyltransferase involved in LPS biosynthesis
MIEKVFVISLLDRNDRLSVFLQNIPNPWPFAPIEVFKAIDGKSEKIPNWWRSTPGAWGCYRSHHEIIKSCINNNIDSVLIFEDDAIFDNEFIDKAKIFFDNLPNDWEMCYLGGQHLNKPSDIVINNAIAIGTNINRTHAYAINKSGFKKLDHYLSIDPWPIKKHHIDHMYGYLHKNNIIKPYCPLNMIVGQDAGQSDIVDFIFPLRWWSIKHK